MATATEANWDFLGRIEVVEAVRRAARQAARLFDDVTFDEAENEALLWLAVRPERVAKAVETGQYHWLSSDIYANGLREQAVSRSDKAKVTESWDVLISEGGEQ